MAAEGTEKSGNGSSEVGKSGCQVCECLASVSPAGLLPWLRAALLRCAALVHSCSFTKGTNDARRVRIIR
jgi:hypothetical protein